MTTTPQPALPGLEPPAPSAGVLERAVHAHFAELGDLAPLETIRYAMCLELAQVMEAKRHGGRMSTYSNDSKLLAELLGLIGEDGTAAAGVDAELRRAIDAWTEHEHRRAS